MRQILLPIILVSWLNNSEIQTGFEVWRNGRLVDTINNKNAREYKDKSGKVGDCYRIVAVAKNERSKASEEGCAIK